MLCWVSGVGAWGEERAVQRVVACGRRWGMEIRLRQCCCSLDTAVGVGGGVMAAMYLVLGVVAVGWVVLHSVGDGLEVGSVLELDSLDEAYEILLG